MKSLEVFRNHIVTAPNVVDPEGVHHEFVSGMHGRKLDFDAIPTDSPLFDEWVTVTAQAIGRLYDGQALGNHVLLSVTNGTNRLVRPVAGLVKGGIVPLQTKKVSPKAVELTAVAAETFAAMEPDFVLALEDVGTKGTTAASAVAAARKAGALRVEVLNTWQRRPELEELVGIGAVYNSMIHEDMPTLTAAECQASGYCSQDWELIEHA
ncbi:MAG TPA: hypothetical protein VGO07_00640 [Candidatus Saccharimonadales bacterium]|nr:hypothetical protein [Candidatus Saccharimonadales bacterium]